MNQKPGQKSPPLDKFREGLNKIVDVESADEDCQYDKPIVVLTLSGSFNPVHSSHVNIFEVAKQCLSDRYWVVAGFLAPSSDEYLQSKLGKEAMSLQHRNQMCRLSLPSTASASWVDVIEWGLASSSRVREYCQEACRNCASQMGGRHAELAHRIIGAELCGADYAIRAELWKKDSRIYVCAGRDIHTLQTKLGLITQAASSTKLASKDRAAAVVYRDKLKQLTKGGERRAKVRGVQPSLSDQEEEELRVLLRQLFPTFFLVDSHELVAPISSTIIRKAIQQAQDHKMANELTDLVKQGFLHPLVMEYLISQGKKV